MVKAEKDLFNMATLRRVTKNKGEQRPHLTPAHLKDSDMRLRYKLRTRGPTCY